MLKEPDSMEGLAYFTRQNIGDGNAVAWVKKGPCPKCKTLMGKPVVKGKIKIRAKEYQCPKCEYIEPKEEHVERLDAEIMYVCPGCKKKGEHTMPFKRKKIKVKSKTEDKEITVDALVFNCDKCDEKVIIPKKMKG
ncbi:MAG: hypothetical protein QF486_03720 [Candidatus Woesearchaeota archaeon]|jgi:DNA-directed RNA polymerase subunit M/transcription elongation factor TFIIS|nr:hypothetical protein [Candidatus Woesearchaeota archaeon]MDP7198705.1 hypothetical protein [Candidatus Woesearchaeota archaeon]MDP7467679.1 hypothetical protein [Candidatus Woesearchaeota archaeon]MDP7647248.1 hypothetical protein [Candidatus Woesearchaeota archaeon]|tara:strand:- start:1025 stop:1432 length:408 start_codon:yes stop_codon:yes gene_type:complete